MAQLVKMKFLQVRNLRGGGTAWFGDIAEVPYDEALDCVRCEVAFPCNDQGGQEAMPERTEVGSMEEATQLINYAPEAPAEPAEAIVESEEEIEETVGDPRLGEPRKKKSHR